MAQINLLPWRDLLREERKRHFLIAWGMSFFLCVGIMLIGFLFMRMQINHQLLVNQFLNKEIARLQADIITIENIKKEKAALLSRVGIIQQLQDLRPVNVRLFDEMPRILPGGIFFTKMQRIANVLTIVGQAESNSRISEFMRNIEQSKWFTMPILTEIKSTHTAKQAKHYREFELQLHQTLMHTEKKATS